MTSPPISSSLHPWRECRCPVHASNSHGRVRISDKTSPLLARERDACTFHTSHPSDHCRACQNVREVTECSACAFRLVDSIGRNHSWFPPLTANNASPDFFNSSVMSRGSPLMIALHRDSKAVARLSRCRRMTSKLSSAVLHFSAFGIGTSLMI